MIKQQKLKDGEVLAKVDTYTGDVEFIENKPKKVVQGYETFKTNAVFKKLFPDVLAYLDSKLNKTDMYVVHKMIMLSDQNGSLRPLNDETTIPLLVDSLGVGKNRVKQALKRIFELGVYGSFNVAEHNRKHGTYWILNPYLCVYGNRVESDVLNLFKNTTICKIHTGEISW